MVHIYSQDRCVVSAPSELGDYEREVVFLASIGSWTGKQVPGCSTQHHNTGGRSCPHMRCSSIAVKALTRHGLCQLAIASGSQRWAVVFQSSGLYIGPTECLHCLPAF
jgi:hypothetical protein